MALRHSWNCFLSSCVPSTEKAFFLSTFFKFCSSARVLFCGGTYGFFLVSSSVKRSLCSSRKFRISRVQRSPSMAKSAGFSQREMWWWRGESLLFSSLSRSVHSGFPRVGAVYRKRVVRVRRIEGITVILDQEVE